MKISKAQIEKWNNGAAEGFEIDLQQLILQKEKTLIARGPIREDSTFFVIVLRYRAETIGTGWQAKETGKQLLMLEVTRYIPTESENMFNVNYDIYAERIGEPQNKKMFAYMQKQSFKIDVDSILAIAEERCPIEKAESIETKEAVETVAKYNQLEDSTGLGIMFEIVATHEIAKTVSGYIVLFDIDHFTDKPKSKSEHFNSFEAAESFLKESRSVIERTWVKDSANVANDSDFVNNAGNVPETVTEFENIPESVTESEKEITIAEESGQDEAGPNPDMFEALAKAYLSGKQFKSNKKKEAKKDSVPPKVEELEQTIEETTEDPTEIAPGYSENDNERIPEFARIALSKGEQVIIGEDYKRLLFTMTYSNNVKCIYSISMYHSDSIPAGHDANYEGFLIGTNFYHYRNAKPIAEKFSADINRRLIQLIPDEETARKNAGNLEGYDKRDVESEKNYSRKGSAQRLFYDSRKPELTLYSNARFGPDELIKYILDPKTAIEDYAKAYAEDEKIELYKKWIAFNNISKEYAAIVENPNAEEHQLKAIRNSVNEEKTVRIELSDGKEIKVEACAIKWITAGGYISSHYVSAADRELVDKDIKAPDIAAIRHGSRILYQSSIAS